MLEFMEQCNQGDLYERAIDCERAINNKNPITNMAVFLENLFKLIYLDLFKSDDIDAVQYKDFSEILQNSIFISYLKKTYCISNVDINIVNTKIRTDSNNLKHKPKAPKVSKFQIKESFHCLYNIAASYYSVKTGEKKPQWDDDEYNKMVDKYGDRSKIIAEIELLKNALDKSETEKFEYLKKYEDAKTARDDAIRDSISPEILLEYQSKDDSLREEIANKDREILILSQKERWNNEQLENILNEINVLRTSAIVENEEKKQQLDQLNVQFNAIKKDADSLRKQNLKLLEQIEILNKQQTELNNQMMILGSTSSNQNIIELANDEVKKAKRNKNLAIKKYNKIKQQLLINEKYIYEPDDELAYANKSYLDYVFEQDNSDNNLIPNCPYCGEKLIPKPPAREGYSYYWTCTDPNNTHSKYNRSAGSEDLPILLKELKKRNRKITIQSRDNQRLHGFNQHYQLNRHDNRSQIHLFQSIAVPGELFPSRLKLELDHFSRFSLKSTLPRREVPVHIRLLYSLGLRLLNRGTVLPSNKITETVLEKRFNNKSIGSIGCLNKNGVGPECFHPVTMDEKFLVACKLSHQISIAIMKGLEQGYFGNQANLIIHSSTDMFSNAEWALILSTAVTEVYDIIHNYAIIYNEKIQIDLFNPDSSDVILCFDDKKDIENSSLIISDFYDDINFLCDYEDFDLQDKPLNPDYSALSFFLDYVFFYPDFREGQFEAISNILLRNNSIVLLPTGAGKSLIYQLASFIVPGIIVVISPLVSLMDDQVFNLSYKFGITGAIQFHSANSPEEKQIQEHNKLLLQQNVPALIYCSPERLHIPAFIDDISVLMKRNNVYAVAIDEAHCVSEWGHEFRSAYLNIGNTVKSLFKNSGDIVPVIVALTGTASDAVLNDVRRELRFTDTDVLIQPDSFDRKELRFSLVKCPAEEKIYQTELLIKDYIPQKFGLTYYDFIRRSPGETNSGIIFTPYAISESNYSAQRMAALISCSMQELGLGCYFSNTPALFDKKTWAMIKKNNANRFKRDELNILVATNAFGMGIDKPNIRFIIHDGLPVSIEQYYQEAGRAGRDGKHSECVLLFSDELSDENEKLLGANLTWDDFQRAYQLSSHFNHSSVDDISAQLWFHYQTFSGLDRDYAVINKTIKELYGHSCGEVISKPVERKNEDQVIKAVVRLMNLGVILGYSYDYNGTLEITVGNLDKESVVNAFSSYLQNDNKDVKDYYLNKIRSLDADDATFVENSANVLIEYIYEVIEQGRRRSMSEMYYLAKEASAKCGDEQDAFIRNTIVSYFSYSGVNRDELKAISTGENAGLSDIIPFWNLYPNQDYCDSKKANTIYIRAGRLLESKPDHPGLLLTQAVAKILSSHMVDSGAKSNIIAAISYARSRYSVPIDNVISPYFAVLNLVLSVDLTAFDELVSNTHNLLDYSKTSLLSLLASSEYIDDNYRSYILLSYIHEVIEKME